MFQQYEFFVIHDGDDILSVSDDGGISWTSDIALAFQFTTEQEADIYCQAHVKTPKETLSVKRVIVQYIVPED